MAMWEKGKWNIKKVLAIISISCLVLTPLFLWVELYLFAAIAVIILVGCILLMQKAKIQIDKIDDLWDKFWYAKPEEICEHHKKAKEVRCPECKKALDKS